MHEVKWSNIRYLTSELKRIWQTLQEMIGRLVFTSGTPKVWLITAFWTGSIWIQSRRKREGKEKGRVKLNSGPTYIRQTKSLLMLMERSRWQYSGSRTWLGVAIWCKESGHLWDQVRVSSESPSPAQMLSSPVFSHKISMASLINEDNLITQLPLRGHT